MGEDRQGMKMKRVEGERGREGGGRGGAVKGNKGGSGAVGMEDMLILRDHDNHIMVVL